MRRLLLGWMVLLAALALAGCGPDGSVPATLDVSSLATGVAQTMTAMTPVPHALPTLAPIESPGAPLSPSPTTGRPSRVVYISGGDIWLVDVSAPAVQLTNSGKAEQAMISDDGAAIAYSRRDSLDGPAEIWAVNPDGTHDRVLLTAAQLNALHPLKGMKFNDLANLSFVPRTHRLAYNTRGVAEGPGLAKYDDLNVIDIDSGAQASLLPAGSGGDFTFSPDGARVAITHATNVNLADADGTHLQTNLITFPLINTASEYLYYPKVVWAADGSAFVVVIPSQEPFTPPTSGSLWRVTSGGAAANLGIIIGDFFRTTGGYPLQSPDLANVAFTRDTSTPNVHDLYIAHADGTGETKVATGTITWQGWSPDGQHYLFTQGSPSTLMLGTMGGTPTSVGAGTNPQWLDASRFVYVAGGSGTWTLEFDALGSSPQVMASISGDLATFDVAP